MEHRLHPRARLRVPVIVRRRDEAVAIGQIRDMSADGAFIAVNPDHRGIGVGTLVKLELLLGRRRARASAVVVHRREDGIGVMFTEARAAPSRAVAGGDD